MARNSTKKSKLRVVEIEWSNGTVEHAIYSPVSGLSFLYVDTVPVGERVVTVPEGVVTDISVLTTVDINKIMIDSVNSDAEKGMQFVCRFLLFPTFTFPPAASMKFAKDSKSSILLTTMPRVALATARYDAKGLSPPQPLPRARNR